MSQKKQEQFEFNASLLFKRGYSTEHRKILNTKILSLTAADLDVVFHDFSAQCEATIFSQQSNSPTEKIQVDIRLLFTCINQRLNYPLSIFNYFQLLNMLENLANARPEISSYIDASIYNRLCRQASVYRQPEISHYVIHIIRKLHALELTRRHSSPSNSIVKFIFFPTDTALCNLLTISEDLALPYLQSLLNDLEYLTQEGVFLKSYSYEENPIADAITTLHRRIMACHEQQENRASGTKRKHRDIASEQAPTTSAPVLDEATSTTARPLPRLLPTMTIPPRNRPAALDISTSASSLSSPSPASQRSTPSRAEIRANNLIRLSAALSENDTEALANLLKEIGVSTHFAQKRPSTPACASSTRQTPTSSFSVFSPSPTHARGSQSSPEQRQAALLILEFIKEQLKTRTSINAFHTLISGLTSQSLALLLSPFHKNLKLFYDTIGSTSVIDHFIHSIDREHLPQFINELEKLTIKRSFDSLQNILRMLSERMKRNADESEMIMPIYKDLLVSGYIYHHKATRFTTTHHHVLNNLFSLPHARRMIEAYEREQREVSESSVSAGMSV